MEKNLFKAKSDTSAWKNLKLSKPTIPAKVTAKTSSQAKNCQKESKSAAQEEFPMKLNKKSNSPWSKISMPESSMSINDTEKFSSTHPNNKKQINVLHTRNANNKFVSNQSIIPQNKKINEKWKSYSF